MTPVASSVRRGVLRSGRVVPAAVARIAPFAVYMMFLGLVPMLGAALPELDSRWLYPVKIAFVMGALLLCRRGYSELRDWRGAEMPAAAVVGVLVFALWINLEQPWAMLGGDVRSGYDPRDGSGAIVWPLALLRVFGAAVIVPVMEELFWRSFVMRWVDDADFLAISPRAASLRAVLLTAVAFGFEHRQWLAGVLAGLAYGELYRRSGRLAVPIVAHAVTNLALGLWVLATGSWRFW